MNFYEKIRDAEYEIPEVYDLTVPQVDDLIHNADVRDRYDLVCMAFKFGYMQGCRAGHTCKTNNAPEERGLDQVRRNIIDMVSRIGREDRLRRIFFFTHMHFINDGQGALDERQD